MEVALSGLGIQKNDQVCSLVCNGLMSSEGQAKLMSTEQQEIVEVSITG